MNYMYAKLIVTNGTWYGAIGIYEEKFIVVVELPGLSPICFQILQLFFVEILLNPPSYILFSKLFPPFY